MSGTHLSVSATSWMMRWTSRETSSTELTYWRARPAVYIASNCTIKFKRNLKKNFLQSHESWHESSGVSYYLVAGSRGPLKIQTYPSHALAFLCRLWQKKGSGSPFCGEEFKPLRRLWISSFTFSRYCRRPPHKRSPLSELVFRGACYIVQATEDALGDGTGGLSTSLWE